MEPNAIIKIDTEIANTLVERVEALIQVHWILRAAWGPVTRPIGNTWQIEVRTTYGLLLAAADQECPGWREEGRFQIVPVGLPEL
jgi:hypothetical protein